jgi:serine/threonine kinase PknH
VCWAVGAKEVDVDGTPFGRYRLIEVLGRGGMGVVWKAYDTFADRIVAIKVLAAQLSEDDEFQERFRSEALAAGRLSDPHVIPIHSYGEIDGRLYVDMRFIEGRDLQTIISDGPLSATRTVRIIEQVAKALNAAHDIGLVHRDVKPSNILLDKDDFAYLIDFGIVRDTGKKKLTGTGAPPLGTWAYMSPERMRSGEADARADIYALACVLYECLTGSQPFPGDTFESLAIAHLEDPPPRPSATQPTVPQPVDEVIATGMAKDPAQRYETTIALADAARDAITVPIGRSGLQTAQPTAAPKPRPDPASVATRYRQPRPPERTWNPTAATQGPDGPLSHAALSLPAAPSADSRTNPQTFQAPRRRRGLITAVVSAVVVLVCGVIAITGYLVLDHRRSSSAPAAQAASTPQLPPLPPNALNALLLSIDKINSAMDSSGMSAVATMTSMPDFSSRVPDRACLALAYAVQPDVYSGSGWSIMRSEIDQKPEQNAVNQAVVLFPSSQAASSFLAASAKSWTACSGRQFIIAMNGNSQVHTVGPVANTNGTLSATVTPAGTLGFCERALTVAKNVAIDVATCAGPPGAAVNIAHQIAAKV